MSSSSTQGRSQHAGIRATKGQGGGLRASLRPLAQAALASAMAASGSAAAQAAAAAPAPVQQAPQPAAPAQQQPSSEAQPDASAQDAAQGNLLQAPEDQLALPTVRVEEERDPGYNPPTSNLKRLPKPLVDTPQTVTVVPEKVMEQQVATTLADALRNVSGITVAAGEGGRQGDAFVLRGFSAQTDTTRDGVRDLGWFTRDTFNVQNVEVFFGPSAVLFGRGSTGGAVNLATKRPLTESFQELKLIGGTAPMGRVEADVNEALSEKLQLRLNAMGQLDNVAGRDVTDRNRAGVAPSVHVKLGDKTALDVDYLWQHEDGVPDYGQPYLNGRPLSISLGVPRDTFYGLEADQTLVNAHIATGTLEHRFSEHLRLSNTLRYGHVNRFSRPTSPRFATPVPAAPTVLGRQRYETSTDNTNLINQTDLRAELATGPAKHTLNFGVELARETRDQYRDDLRVAGAPGFNSPADLYSPDPSETPGPMSRFFRTTNDTLQRSAGVYASDQVALTKYLELLGSLRLDTFDTLYVATNVATNGAATDLYLPAKDTFLNWRAGLVLHPLEATSLYAMYGTSKNPSAEAGTLTNDTVSLEPEDNHTYEVGAKADLLEERLSLSAAVFRIEKTNARVANAEPPPAPPTILGGENRVQGFNVGIAGQPVRWLNVLANYTFMDAEVLSNPNPADPSIGARLPQTPKHSLSLWSTVNPVKGLSLGGGAVYQDVTAVNVPTVASPSINYVPNFWRFDAVAIYAWRNTELQLNLNNLTNTLYYAQYYAGHAVPADGRSATLSARVRF
ncbi:TonB-dependent siderophore receptor [Aggregicoccus sp. 17bor-14]|uniref:TonB-dependent receptor n=1 Tax=Myxococcaceae TaxID=31 RepID=UPI00129C1771|nr:MULTISPECIES: TonB-dependent siderophore receptor [Myxococcaceae]MBF5042958.1 TonB-dependent siderophore receptor [Simulacricoccus sp. 17bor-14]MRI88724.1 TonB-dependent siderophore receptor [Aggregicoccus sp. 17bor-14]